MYTCVHTTLSLYIYIDMHMQLGTVYINTYIYIYTYMYIYDHIVAIAIATRGRIHWSPSGPFPSSQSLVPSQDTCPGHSGTHARGHPSHLSVYSMYRSYGIVCTDRTVYTIRTLCTYMYLVRAKYTKYNQHIVKYCHVLTNTVSLGKRRVVFQ